MNGGHEPRRRLCARHNYIERLPALIRLVDLVEQAATEATPQIEAAATKVVGAAEEMATEVVQAATEFFQVIPRFFLALIAVALFQPGAGAPRR